MSTANVFGSTRKSTEDPVPGLRLILNQETLRTEVIRVPKATSSWKSNIEHLQAPFADLRDLFKKHYPHPIHPSWINHVTSLANTFRGSYVVYAYEILYLQASLHDPTCVCDVFVTHKWYGFVVDEQAKVIWSVNPDVRVGYTITHKDSKPLSTWKQEFRSYCRGSTNYTKEFFWLQDWLPRNLHDYTYLTMIDRTTQKEYLNRVYYVYDSYQQQRPSEKHPWRIKAHVNYLTSFITLHGRLTLKSIFMYIPTSIQKYSTHPIDLDIDLRNANLHSWIRLD